MSASSLACVLAFLLAGGPVWAGEKKPAALEPETLHSRVGSASWEWTQFVQADKKGQIFILRGDTGDVLRLMPNDRLEKAQTLAGTAENENEQIVRAAMGAHGDWILQMSGRGALRLFRNGKEEPIAKPLWFVNALGMAGDDPVISVLPKRAGGVVPPDYKLPDQPPVVLSWDGEEWDSLIEEKLPESEEFEIEERQALRVLALPDGDLWLANDFAHRFRRFSPRGRLLGEIVVGKGTPVRKDDGEKAQEQFEKKMNQRGLGPAQGTQAAAATAQPVLSALAEGRDGRMYFLVQNGDGALFLQRYDPAPAVLEQVRVELPARGQMSMVGGKDGLYVAAFLAKNGLWRLSWERLDAASWSEVEGVKIDNFEKQESQEPAA